jgi:hypothetical protein
MKNNLLMTEADKEAVSFEQNLRHNIVIDVFKKREEKLRFDIEDQRILKGLSIYLSIYLFIYLFIYLSISNYSF